MVEASYLATFFGGVLTLLSPCSALLLPAFFAYAFQSKGELVKKTGIFYLGLATTLIPLGLGISAVSMLFYGQRNTLILVAGLLIIALGIFQLVGGGFGFGPLARLQGKIKGGSAGSTYALGAVYGFAGFCSGPILGAVHRGGRLRRRPAGGRSARDLRFGHGRPALLVGASMGPLRPRSAPLAEGA